MHQMGYGSRAIQALNAFYSGEYFNLDESGPRVETEYPDAAAIDPVRLSSLALSSPETDVGAEHRPSQ